jgi:glutamate/aspartate transport system permease protein
VLPLRAAADGVSHRHPPLTSETMNLIKNSSIALTIGLAELTFRSREIGEYTFNFFEAFTAATVIYIVSAMTANRVMALSSAELRCRATSAAEMSIR